MAFHVDHGNEMIMIIVLQVKQFSSENIKTYFAFDFAIIFAHFFALKNFAVNIEAKSAYLKPGR